MHVIGRFERVRLLSATHVSTSLILDRKSGGLTHYEPPEWVRVGARWSAIPRGGVGMQAGAQQPMTSVLGLLDAEASGTPVFVNLDSAYVAGTSGDAVGGRIFVLSAKTLSRVSFYLLNLQGTAANTNDLDLFVYGDDGSQIKPATGTVIASATAYNPASTAGWHHVTLSASLSALTPYWVSLHDPDGTATDYARAGQRAWYGFGLAMAAKALGLDASSTNGWTTTTLGTGAPLLVLGFADGTAQGQPFAGWSNGNNNAAQRGLLVDGLRSAVKVTGFLTTAVGSLTGGQIWSGTTGPTGTPVATSTTRVRLAAAATYALCLFAPSVTLAANTPYRCVFTYSGLSTIPGRMILGTGGDATMRKAMLGGGSWCWTEDVAGTWTEDQNGWPSMGVLVEDWVPSGGESAGLTGSLLNRGLN